MERKEKAIATGRVPLKQTAEKSWYPYSNLSNLEDLVIGKASDPPLRLGLRFGDSPGAPFLEASLRRLLLDGLGAQRIQPRAVAGRL